MLRSIFNVIKTYKEIKRKDPKEIEATEAYNKCLVDIKESLEISLDNFSLSPIETSLLKYELILSKLPKYSPYGLFSYFSYLKHISGFIDSTGLLFEYTLLLRRYNDYGKYLKSNIFYYDCYLDNFFTNFLKTNFDRESIISGIKKKIEQYKEKEKNFNNESLDSYLLWLDNKYEMNYRPSDDDKITLFLMLKKKYGLI